MNHTCQAIVFRCMDFRIDPAVFAQLLAKENICEVGQFDLVSLAGAAKSFLSDGKDLLLSQIEISSRLHGVKKIVLVMHDNCGAYGIADPGQEEELQKNDLEKVTAIISKNFPNLALEKFILKGTASGNLSLVKI